MKEKGKETGNRREFGKPWPKLVRNDRFKTLRHCFQKTRPNSEDSYTE
jgi:hypothetical protein